MSAEDLAKAGLFNWSTEVHSHVCVRCGFTGNPPAPHGPPSYMEETPDGQWLFILHAGDAYSTFHAPGNGHQWCGPIVPAAAFDDVSADDVNEGLVNGALVRAYGPERGEAIGRAYRIRCERRMRVLRDRAKQELYGSLYGGGGMMPSYPRPPRYEPAPPRERIVVWYRRGQENVVHAQREEEGTHFLCGRVKNRRDVRGANPAVYVPCVRCRTIVNPEMPHGQD